MSLICLYRLLATKPESAINYWQFVCAVTFHANLFLHHGTAAGLSTLKAITTWFVFSQFCIHFLLSRFNVSISWFPMGPSDCFLVSYQERKTKENQSSLVLIGDAKRTDTLAKINFRLQKMYFCRFWQYWMATIQYAASLRLRRKNTVRVTYGHI